RDEGCPVEVRVVQGGREEVDEDLVGRGQVLGRLEGLAPAVTVQLEGQLRGRRLLEQVDRALLRRPRGPAREGLVAQHPRPLQVDDWLEPDRDLVRQEDLLDAAAVLEREL